ncbi:MAG: hypothetical protein R3336_07465, partial [Phycisphaeraceae bacterium]|nr:hypothetical protein [Phycisphaeraceae bacterium]
MKVSFRWFWFLLLLAVAPVMALSAASGSSGLWLLTQLPSVPDAQVVLHRPSGGGTTIQRVARYRGAGPEAVAAGDALWMVWADGAVISIAPPAVIGHPGMAYRDTIREALPKGTRRGWVVAEGRPWAWLSDAPLPVESPTEESGSDDGATDPTEGPSSPADVKAEKGERLLVHRARGWTDVQLPALPELASDAAVWLVGGSTLHLVTADEDRLHVWSRRDAAWESSERR